MKTENMKLLDLQTGKYLQLDKDFWFGGNVIILFENLKRSTNTYSLLDEVNACARFIKQPPTDPIVNEIAGTVGAVVYGGRYVLFLDPAMGSAYNIKNEYRREEFIDYKCKNGDFSSGYNFYNNDMMTFLGNIFEEYSKQLRNEPNKFDELNELLK